MVYNAIEKMITKNTSRINAAEKVSSNALYTDPQDVILTCHPCTEQQQ